MSALPDSRHVALVMYDVEYTDRAKAAVVLDVGEEKVRVRVGGTQREPFHRTLPALSYRLDRCSMLTVIRVSQKRNNLVGAPRGCTGFVMAVHSDG